MDVKQGESLQTKHSFLAALGLLIAVAASAQEAPRGAFSDPMTPTNTTTARVSSYDASGGNVDLKSIVPGQTLDLGTLEGAGITRHLYFSVLGGENYLRDLVLRAYWDGSSTPCVFGTFGLNSYFPMPYARGARLTLTNEGTEHVLAVWHHIEYEKMAKLPAGLSHFHATWNRVNKTAAIGEKTNVTQHSGINKTGDDSYVLLDAQVHGALAGIFLSIDNTMGSWYGEGDDMIFIDGERWPPSYHGTGTEEILGGGLSDR